MVGNRWCVNDATEREKEHQLAKQQTTKTEAKSHQELSTSLCTRIRHRQLLIVVMIAVRIKFQIPNTPYGFDGQEITASSLEQRTNHPICIWCKSAWARNKICILIVVDYHNLAPTHINETSGIVEVAQLTRRFSRSTTISIKALLLVGKKVCIRLPILLWEI